MDLNVRLEDERFCNGCPLDCSRLTCKGGFTRSLAALAEQEYSGSIFLEGGTKIETLLIRPQSCLFANERAAVAVEKTRAKTAAGKGKSYVSILDHYAKIIDEIEERTDKKSGGDK